MSRLLLMAATARSTATSTPTPVTPAAPSFSDLPNTLTIPSTTGVQYRQDGINIAAGVYGSEPAGPTTISAVAKSGHVIATGATTSWNHTYPVSPTLPPTKPAAYDSTVASLRPSVTIQQTLTVGPSSCDYTTVEAAVNAAKTTQTTHPGVRWPIDIIVYPGTYNDTGNLDNMGWINVYGATYDPADVVVTCGSDGLGTFRIRGPGYLENITVATDDTASPATGPRYPLHLTTQHPSLGTVGAVVGVNCHFLARNPQSTGGGGSGNGAAIGLDLYPATEVVFYQCEVTPDPGGTSTTILHGVASTGVASLTFVECTVHGILNYDGAGAADDFWVADTSASSLRLNGAGAVATLHASGSSAGLSQTLVSSAVSDSNASWPLPTWAS